MANDGEWWQKFAAELHLREWMGMIHNYSQSSNPPHYVAPFFRTNNIQGLVNVSFVPFWAFGSHHFRYLGDVQLGHLPTPEMIKHGGKPTILW